MTKIYNVEEAAEGGLKRNDLKWRGVKIFKNLAKNCRAI
jgi:hypothetical protein